ncbi:putative retrotransposon gag domain, aspartic peptidase domain protein [Tanacetum coccineum]|uniref:Retrotransposon gag domain, aspartic peptidase domain protein n=1 Tax=Tanacetum coccineum TaxID=301880 RepID=A0ABQ5FVA3_9ASTR
MCKLDKALYGLKQAPRAWYETLSKFLHQHKFVKGTIDNTLFTYKTKSDIISVQIYVDDIIIGSTSVKLNDNASVKCPMLPLNNLGPDESGISINETLFRGMIGSLMYLTASRPDIQFSTCLCTSAKKKSSVVMSSAEDEYVVATGCCAQVLWIKIQLADYDVLYDKYTENFSPLPPKKTVRAALATLGLVDENNPELSSTDLVKSSSLRTRYFSATWKVPLTSYMRKVAEISHQPKKSLVLSSREVNAKNTGDKPFSETFVHHVSQSKSTTDKRPKKNKIPSSSDLKASKDVRHSDDDYQIKFMGPIYSDMDDDADAKDEGIEITLDDSFKNNEVHEAESDLESMPRDEIESVSGFKATKTEDDDTQSQHKKELSNSEENVVDNVLDELADMANSHNIEFNSFATKPSLSDPLGYLHTNLRSLTSRVKHLESSLAQQIIKDSVKQALPKFDKRVKKTLNAEIPKLLIKPLNNAFNLLNKRNATDKGDVNLCELVDLIRDLVVLIDSASASAKAALEGEDPNEILIKQANADKEMADAQREQSSKQAPSTVKKVLSVTTALVVQSSEDKPTEDEPPFKRLSLFNITSSEFSPTPLKDDKVKGVASEEDPLKELIPLIDEEGDDPLPITKISYRVNNSNKEASMRIIKDNQPLNLTVYDKFVLKMLGFSEWVEVYALASKVKTQAAKLGIPSPPQLKAFKLPPAERKVEGVVGKAGMVIKETEAGIFLYNGNFNLVFYIRSQYALASIPRLIRIQNLFKIDSEYVQHVYDELIYEIESRPDFVQVREIVEKNQDGRFEEMAIETEKNAASGNTVIDENRGVETSMSDLKTQVEGLEGLDSDFTNWFMGEIMKKQEDFREEVSTLHQTIEDLQADVALCKRSLASSSDNTNHGPKINVPKPSPFVEKREARAVDDFLWEMEQYLEGTATIDTWAGFVVDFKKQFYSENAKNEAKSQLHKLKQFEAIWKYVKEFATLVLEIPELFDQDSLFYFLDGLQGWAKMKLERRGVQDLSMAISHVEALIEFNFIELVTARRKRAPMVCWLMETKTRVMAGVGSIRILNAIKLKTEVPKVVGKGLQYVEATINGVKVRAFVDSGTTHNFMADDEAKRLGINATKRSGTIKTVNSSAKAIHGVAKDIRAKIA